MNKVCGVCQGSQKVRLPYYQPIPMLVAAADEKIDEPRWKEYPCPECTPITSKDQVRVLECHFRGDTRYEQEPGYHQHMRRNATHAIAHEIEKVGFLRLQEGKADDHEMVRPYRVTVGVVSPQVVASLDAEREAAENTFAARVVELATKAIGHWGSYYGHQHINKQDAYRLLGGAIDQAKLERLPLTQSQNRNLREPTER